MLAVKVMQTGQASFSAARVALMARHSGRGGSWDACTPPTLSSSPNSSPWGKVLAQGWPETAPALPSHSPCVHSDPASLPDNFHPGSHPSALIPHPNAWGPQIPVLRPCPTAPLSQQEACWLPTTPQKETSFTGSQDSWQLCPRWSDKGLGGPTALPGASPSLVSPCGVYLVYICRLRGRAARPLGAVAWWVTWTLISSGARDKAREVQDG